MQAKRLHRQSGISLILVIFVLIVLGLLAAVMVRMSAISGDSVAREVVSTRALLAAESGAQRQMNLVFSGGACANGTLSFPIFSDCEDVDISCEAINDVDSHVYYLISSTATCGPIDQRAVRKVELQARSL